METNAKNLPKNFTPDYVMKGQQGEQIVAHVLRKEGYFVTCLTDIKGGAPGMTNDETFLILPDLQAALRGKLGYCEVKWKTASTYTIITQREEHGVDKINWDHYLEIHAMTGLPVFLFIYELSTGAVLYNATEFLSKVLRYSPKMGKGGMCFFPRASFYLWGRVVQLGNDYYQQLDMFTMQTIEGDGDKLFGIIQHEMRTTQ